MTEHEDDKDPHPSDSTEEFLLGALDEGAQPLPAKPADPSGDEPVAADPVQPEEPAEPSPADGPESEAPAAPGPEASSESDSPQPGQPGEYVEQPTEEVFALEARLLDGDDVPDLDPVFRAALLESPESVAAKHDAGETGEFTAEHEVPPGDDPATGEHTGEHPDETGEHDEGTQEWDLPSEGQITAEQTAVLAAAAKSEVHHAIETSRKSGEPWDPRRPPVGGDFEPPGKRKHYWWRFGLATLIIVFSFAGATSASILNVFNGLAGDIGSGSNKISIADRLLPDSNGGPQTIAILGSDVRTGGGTLEGDPGRSDTTLLMRLDPDSGQIAMLSIPRDLKVEIPGYGTDKFNAAFSYGGPELTLKTIKSLTGLEVNHVINIDFQGFADVVDAIGCVFVDVDREYYHSNEGLPAAEQYAEINIPAGYQKLCGSDALEFARYRHNDSDLSRAARQQDLVGEVRNRLGFSEILKRSKELTKAFADNTKSDIKDGDEILELLKLLFDSKNANVTEISFPASDTLENGISYLVTTQDEIDGVVDQFLGFEDQAGPVGTLDEGVGVDGDGNRTKQAKANRAKARKRAKAEEASKTTAPTQENDGLVDASIDGQGAAKNIDDQIKREFPIFYPKRLPSSTYYSEGSRRYGIRDPDKNVYAAYRLVMTLEASDGTHYFGLQGLRGWTDPPILEAPHDEITMDDRSFNVYYEGDRIRLVSWQDGDNTYWISNSILLTLENEQMLGMARSSKAFTSG